LRRNPGRLAGLGRNNPGAIVQGCSLRIQRSRRGWLRLCRRVVWPTCCCADSGRSAEIDETRLRLGIRFRRGTGSATGDPTRKLPGIRVPCQSQTRCHTRSRTQVRLRGRWPIGEDAASRIRQLFCQLRTPALGRLGYGRAVAARSSTAREGPGPLPDCLARTPRFADRCWNHAGDNAAGGPKFGEFG